MFSAELNCIFIHIPKTAGSSLENKLGHFTELERSVQDHRAIRDMIPFPERRRIFPFLKDKPRKDLVHWKRRRERFFSNEEVLPIDVYDSCFKFSFVRNPWARAYSWYKNVMRDDYHLRTSGLSRSCTFPQFLLQEHKKQWALKPQLFWLKDFEGKIGVDFVGKFEFLQRDFKVIVDRLELDGVDLPHLLNSGNQSYRHAYDSETQEWVARKYAEEIELFEYDF